MIENINARHPNQSQTRLREKGKGRNCKLDLEYLQAK